MPKQYNKTCFPSTLRADLTLLMLCAHYMQDDPGSDGDLAFQLSSQPSSSHSQLTADLPVNILQVMKPFTL